MTVRWLPMLLALVALSTTALAQPQSLEERDWSRVAATARSEGLPVLVVFTSEDCGYCRRLEQEVLEPLRSRPPRTTRVIIREFSLSSEGKVRDFDGENVRARVFIRRYGVFAAPTALLLGADGKALAPPIVGFAGAEPYRALLRETLDGAGIPVASTGAPATTHRGYY